MYYAQPGKLRWEYTSPYRYTFILNGQTVLLKNTKGNSKIDVNQSKMFKEITRIMMSSVLGTCVSNNRDFNVVLRQGENLGSRAYAEEKTYKTNVQDNNRLLRHEQVNGVRRKDDREKRRHDYNNPEERKNKFGDKCECV